MNLRDITRVHFFRIQFLCNIHILILLIKQNQNSRKLSKFFLNIMLSIQGARAPKKFSEYDAFFKISITWKYNNISRHFISYSLKFTSREAILANLEGIKSKNFPGLLAPSNHGGALFMWAPLKIFLCLQHWSFGLSEVNIQISEKISVTYFFVKFWKFFLQALMLCFINFLMFLAMLVAHLSLKVLCYYVQYVKSTRQIVIQEQIISEQIFFERI